jgi:HlyD family secretion protein
MDDAGLRRTILRSRIVWTMAAMLAAMPMLSLPAVAQAPDPTPANVQTVSVAVVEPAEFRREVRVSGSLVGRRELPVGVEAAGHRIAQVMVEEGQHVAAGQMLARLDAAMVEAQLQRTEALIREAEAAVREAEGNLRRVEAVRGTGAVSAEQVEQRRTAAASAAARLAVTRADRAEVLARLAQAEIRAPAAGLLVARAAQPGMVVQPGGDPLFRILEDGLVELAAEVPERDLAGVRVGQTARLTLSDGTTATGAVRMVAPTVDARSRLGVVNIAIVESQQTLRPGAFARGTIELERRTALGVPPQAILSLDGRHYVTVIEGGRARRVEVTLGQRGRQAVEVRSGLTAGQRIAAAAGAFLRDGEPVRTELAEAGRRPAR